MSAYTVNLLTKKKETVTDKLLYFILHYFRYIIVITQIVVISVFFYRFREDQRIIDLKESFNQKQQILTITVPLIDEAKIIQDKAEQIRVHLDDQEILLNRLEYVFSTIPADTIVTAYQMDSQSISISGFADSILSIRSLNKKLQIKKEFAQAQINGVEKNEEGKFVFNISIIIEQ